MSGQRDIDPAAIAETWAVMQRAELAVGTDELALVAVFESMRLMLVSEREDWQVRGREGLRALIQLMLEAMREHDPEELDRLVEKWRPTAEAAGLEW